MKLLCAAVLVLMCVACEGFFRDGGRHLGKRDGHFGGVIEIDTQGDWTEVKKTSIEAQEIMEKIKQKLVVADAEIHLTPVSTLIIYFI